MNVDEIASHFRGVKGAGRGKYMATCPCHDDRKQSLSITEEQDRVLVKCFAGCDTRDILARAGLTYRDLFAHPPEPSRPEKAPVVATYTYPNGVQKLRRADKSFLWRRPDGQGGWIYNRQGVPHNLYAPKGLDNYVILVEGEKDVDNLVRLGYQAASGEDGAGPGKWRAEYTAQLAGRHVCVVMDNDSVGRDYGREVACALYGQASYVQLLDLRKIWPDIPPHGDVSDLMEAVGNVAFCEKFAQLLQEPEFHPAPKRDDPFLACFKTLDEFEEEEAQWLVPNWMPQGQITLLAADGGIGKTTLWCDILAALSCGKPCILDPPGYRRQPQTVAFLTTEDSVRKKLKKRLRLQGAVMHNILSPDFLTAGSQLKNMKFGSEEMARFVRGYRPALVVFDPVQGFVPPTINMGSRNAMRDCMAPLIALGEETGTTFLVVCHTNKRKGAYGRARISDSADLWDVSRSVIMAGYTEEQGVRYLSNEKNNYAALQETVLFTIDPEGQAHQTGTTWKRDREFSQDTAVAAPSAPKRTDCKQWLLQTLDDHGGTIPSRTLEQAAKDEGFSYSTLQRVKTELKKDGVIRFVPTREEGKQAWTIERTSVFVEVKEESSSPWAS
jgi:hypothetical protein